MPSVHKFSWRTSKALNPNQIDSEGRKLAEVAAPQLAKWWDENDDNAHAAVTSCLDDLMTQQVTRQARLAGWGNLYGQSQYYTGLQRTGNTGTQAWFRNQPDIPYYNVVQSVTDWAVSKLGKDPARVWFCSSGGDYNDWQRAIRMTYMYDGIAYECETPAKLVEMLGDGCVFGDGWIKVLERRNRVHQQRVLSADLWFDEAGAMSGEWPRQMHQLMAMDRARLCALFPDKADKIKASEPLTQSSAYPAPRTSDVVLVRESWHLPSDPDLKDDETDGCHMFSIDGCTLFSEPYTDDFFPFVHFRWTPRKYGWTGQGIPEQLRTRQSALAKLAFLIDRAAHANSMNIIAIEEGSKINPEHVSRNDIKNVITFRERPPLYLNPQPFAKEYIELWNMYVQDSFACVGASMMSATGVKPAGLNSGEAQRVYHDINTERFARQASEFEKCSVDLARLSIHTARKIAKREGGYPVRSMNRGQFEDMDWNDLKLPKKGLDPFVIRAYPTSPLPDEPAGRMAALQERFQVGMISPTEFKRMQMNPDLQTLDAMDTAAENWIYKVFYCATSMDPKDFDAGYWPDERDNLPLFIEIGTQVYEMAKTKGLEPERLALVDRIITAAADKMDEMKKKAMQKAMADQAAMAPPMPPPPGPGAPGLGPLGPPGAPGLVAPSQAPPLPPQPNSPGPGMVQ